VGVPPSDHAGNTSVIGSNDQGYDSDIAFISECTDVTNGSSTRPEGKRAGYVTLQIPKRHHGTQGLVQPKLGFSRNEADGPFRTHDHQPTPRVSGLWYDLAPRGHAKR
jgi:hypothetical protein